MKYAVMISMMDARPKSPSNPRPWMNKVKGHLVDTTIGNYGGFVVDSAQEAQYFADGIGRIGWSWTVFDRGLQEQRQRTIAGMSPFGRNWLLVDGILTREAVSEAERFVADEQAMTVEEIRADPVLRHEQEIDRVDEQAISDINKSMPPGIAAYKALQAQVRELIDHGCESIKLNSKAEDMKAYLDHHSVQREVLILMKKGTPSMPLDAPIPELREYIDNCTSALTTME